MVPRTRFERAAACGGAAFGVVLGLGSGASAQSLLHDVPGLAAGELFGTAVALTGDLDGDGRCDFAATTVAGAQNRGAIRAYSGLDAHLLWEVQGSTAGQRFGASLARIGDVDGDGRPDLIVGAWLASFTGALQTGLARVVSGASGATIREHRGDSAQDHFGWTVAGLGDVDGDTVQDYAVAAVDDDDNGGSAGSVRVFSGATGAALYTLRGTAGEQLLGTSIARVPDADGDGRDDVAVGAPSFASSPQPGYVRLHSGATGALLWSASGSANMDQFGGALAGLGDLDGDGRGEVAVGAKQLTTGAAGYVRVLSGANGAVVREFAGGAAGSRFGTAVAAAGDVDYDGVSDLWVGAPEATNTLSRAGRIDCYSGASGSLLASFDGPAANARLGTAIDGGLDVSGEAGPDAVAAATGDAQAGANSGSARVFRPNDALPPPPPDPHESFEADRLVVSWSAREAQALEMRAPEEFAGARFVVLGSASGTNPGFAPFGLHVPLNPDPYMRASLFAPGFRAISPVCGRLDDAARGAATFQVERRHRSWIGRTFHHAYVVLGDRCKPVFASVAVEVTVAP